MAIVGTCPWCEEPVLESVDMTLSNTPYHTECFVRGIIGGINHLAGRCTCCGGTDAPDPEGLTKREAALVAVRYFRDNHQNVEAIRR